MTALNKQALREAAQEEIMLRSVSDTSDAWQDEASPEAVLALLDELDAKDKSISFLKDQLAQLANFNPDWDKLEAATDSLREHMAELTAARKRIAELEARSFNPAILDVIAERQRQQSVEGWTPEHDNAYQNSELADAAACYAIHAHNQGFSTPAHWPWSPDWWKQSGARRDLIKAGALILAEIERIDRAAGIGVKGE